MHCGITWVHFTLIQLVKSVSFEAECGPLLRRPRFRFQFHSKCLHRHTVLYIFVVIGIILTLMSECEGKIRRWVTIRYNFTGAWAACFSPYHHLNLSSTLHSVDQVTPSDPRLLKCVKICVKLLKAPCVSFFGEKACARGWAGGGQDILLINQKKRKRRRRSQPYMDLDPGVVWLYRVWIGWTQCEEETRPEAMGESVKKRRIVKKDSFHSVF